MTEVFEPTGPHDWRLAAGAPGVLREFNAAGLLSSADVHVASRLTDLAADPDPAVALAVGLAVRAVRHGSVGVDLDAVRDLAVADGSDGSGGGPAPAWPDATTWVDAVAASRLAAQGVIHLEHGLLYLDRYHRQEVQVRDDLAARAAQAPPVVDERGLHEALGRIRSGHLSDEQESAVVRSARQWTTVLTGGPGTGKTTTVARMLALVADQAAARGDRCSIALSAPTGKAAARLQEAVVSEVATMADVDRDRLAGVEAMTLHRLLGWRPDNTTRFRHDRTNRLKYDLIVVDECSMVDLTLMARLLEAVRPEARLVLVGDPHQLTSVGAGAVLHDVVEGYRGRPDSPVAELTRNFRATADLNTLALALHRGDPDEVLAALRTESPEIQYVEAGDPADALKAEVVEAALAVRSAALAGEAEAAVATLDRHRLLCAHREGPHGVHHWNRQVERWLAEATGEDTWSGWYPGRPLLVTANDYALGVYNGDTGVVVCRPDATLRAMISGPSGLLGFATSRLNDVETMHAMTIHKSQGSQADHVTVLLPDEDSRLLTRELFYTAVTRAKRQVRVVGSEPAVRAAVSRRAQRATGLQHRLREG